MEGVRSTCEGDEIHVWGCSDLAVAGVRFTCEGCSDLAMWGSGSPVRVFSSSYAGVRFTSEGVQICLWEG